jgi:hypothetical protein
MTLSVSIWQHLRQKGPWGEVDADGWLVGCTRVVVGLTRGVVGARTLVPVVLSSHSITVKSACRLASVRTLLTNSVINIIGLSKLQCLYRILILSTSSHVCCIRTHNSILWHCQCFVIHTCMLIGKYQLTQYFRILILARPALDCTCR